LIHVIALVQALPKDVLSETDEDTKKFIDGVQSEYRRRI